MSAAGISRTATDTILLVVLVLNVFLVDYCGRNLRARIKLHRASSATQTQAAVPSIPTPSATPSHKKSWMKSCEFVQLIAVCTHLITLVLRITTRLWPGLTPGLCASMMLLGDSLVLVFQPCTTAVLILRGTGVLRRREAWMWSESTHQQSTILKWLRVPPTWSPQSYMRWLLVFLYTLGWVFWILAGWNTFDATSTPSPSELDGLACTGSRVHRELIGPASVLHLCVYVLVAMSFSVPLARHLFHLPTLGSSSSALAAHQPQKKNVTGTSRSAQAIRESIAQVFWSVLIRTLLAIVVHLGVTIADFMGVFDANPHGALVQYSLNNIASLAAASFAAPKKSNKVSSIVATVSAVAAQGAKALLTRTNSARPPKDPTLRRPSATPSVLSTATADSTSLFIATNDPAGGAGGRRPSAIGQLPSTGNRASGLQGWLAKGQEPRANAGSKPASDSLTESAKTHADMISTDFKGPHNEESRVGSSRTDDQMSARGRDE